MCDVVHPYAWDMAGHDLHIAAFIDWFDNFGLAVDPTDATYVGYCLEWNLQALGSWLD
jgi:hypothetical protein